MGAFDDLIPVQQKYSAGAFDDLIPSSVTRATPMDYLRGAAAGSNQIVSGLGVLAERVGADKVGKSLRDIGDEGQKFWMDSMTPAGRTVSKNQVFEDDPNSIIPKLGETPIQSALMGAAQSAPSTVAMAIPGGIGANLLTRGAAGLSARGIGGANMALAGGLASPITTSARIAAAAPSALSMGASEGIVSGAMNAAQNKAEIEQAPMEKLKQVPLYNELTQKLGPDGARAKLAEMAGDDVLLKTALSTGALGILTGGGALGGAYRTATRGAKDGVLKELAKETGNEAFQETVQSGPEQYIQNVAKRDYLDPNQDTMEGVVSQALSGGVTGGLMGGVMGGSGVVAGYKKQQQDQPPATFQPDPRQDSATFPPEEQSAPQGPLSKALASGQPIEQNAEVAPVGAQQQTTQGEANGSQEAAGTAAAGAASATHPGKVLSTETQSSTAPAVPGETIPAAPAASAATTTQAESAGATQTTTSQESTVDGYQAEIPVPAATGQQTESVASTGTEDAVDRTGETPKAEAVAAAAVSPAAEDDQAHGKKGGGTKAAGSHQQDANLLSAHAAALRDKAAQAVGDRRAKLLELAGRLESARDAIVAAKGEEVSADTSSLRAHEVRLRSAAESAVGEAKAKLSSLADRLASARSQIEAQQKHPASEEKQAPDVSQRKAPPDIRKSPPIQRRDDLVGAIMRVTGGTGIHASMAQTLIGEKANRAGNLRGLFTKRGQQDMDDLAMLLRTEEGYDVRDAAHLEDLVRNAGNGNVAVSMERQHADADKAALEKYKHDIKVRALALGIKVPFRKFDEVERDVLGAEQKAANREADEERRAIQEESEADEAYNAFLEFISQEDHPEVNFEDYTSEEELARILATPITDSITENGALTAEAFSGEAQGSDRQDGGAPKGAGGTEEGLNGSENSRPSLTSSSFVKAPDGSIDFGEITGEQAKAVEPAKYKGPDDVSTRAGQMELANRAGTIATLKAMNEQLRKIAPDEAWADRNIEESNDLDGLRDRISQALVDAQRGKQAANPLRNELEALSGKELKAVFDKMGLAGKLMGYEERISALLLEDSAEVRKSIASVVDEESNNPSDANPTVDAEKPAEKNSFTLDRLNRETDSMESVTFERGEYVRYTLSGKDVFGEIDGISHAKHEFSVDGLWYPFGFAYKAERPETPKPADTVPLSKVIDKVNAKHGEGLTEADRVPTATNESLVDQHNAAIAKLYDGDLPVDELKAAFAMVRDNRSAIEAELSKFKKDELLRSGGAMFGYRHKSETKPEIVKAAYAAMLDNFIMGESISYALGGGTDWVTTKVKAIQARVDAATPESLAAYAEKIKANRAEREQRRDETAKAMADPQTLEDYRRLLQAKIDSGKTSDQARMELTPEQRIAMDTLWAEDNRSRRAQRSESAKTEVRVAAKTTSGDIIETKHTKTGQDLFVVKAAERVERDVYNQWNAAAKKLGGWYSSFRGNGAVPGFQFKTRDDAAAFLQYLGGDATAAQEAMQEKRDAFADDRSQSAVERLTEMAERLDERAEESLGRERKANTARRARFAAAAEAAASSDKALAKTMRNIAKAIADGTAKFLDRVRQKAQVELLRSTVKSAQYTELQKKYPSYANQEKHRGEKPTAETADHARWPTFTADRADLARLGRDLLQIDGAKLLGQRILKVADDVTKEYQKFAKENLHKVSVFSAKREGSEQSQPAIFSTADNAEAAIARSGYKGKATTISFKRGEHLVIMGPEMAREAGLWQGDPDRRITLTPEAGEEIVAKVKALGKGKVAMPYVFENVAAERARWKGLGIETAAEQRSALREFIALQEAPAAPDRVKQLERAMVGRANDGLDFFPTPAETAQAMIEAADIQEGMRVLEPSAGMGHIAEQIRDVTGVDPDVIEFSGNRRELLEAKGFNVVGQDFMETVGQYDRIVMNPPFSNRRDAEHVQHAYSLLKPGGRLVAIMGEGVFYGQDRKAQAFREWLEEVGGTSEKLEEGTFLDPSLPVNTATNARMVVIQKPETDKGVALYSKSQDATQSAPITRPEAESRIKSILGDKLGKVLIDSGIVTFTNKGSEYQGATYKDGSIALNLDALNADNFDGVLLHEGFHSTIKQLVGEETYAKLMKQLENMLAMGKGAQWVKDADAAIPSDTKAEHRTEEIAAYSIEQYVNGAKQPNIITRWVESLLSALRTAIIRKLPFGKLKSWAVNNLQPQDLANLAMAGLKAKAAGQVQAQGREAMAFSTAFGKESQHRTPLGDATEIEVDGIKRPALNSNGKPIHWSREGVENFWRWFSDSKVVDAEGRPLVVYHGTSAEFNVFDAEMAGENGISSAKSVIEFTDDPYVASHYAGASEQYRYLGHGAGSVMPVYVRALNPFVVSEDTHGGNFSIWHSFANEISLFIEDDGEIENSKRYGSENIHSKGNLDLLLKFVEENGVPDSVIVTDARWDANDSGANTQYMVFDAGQIKSATGNTGEFSAENPDIRYSMNVFGDPTPTPVENSWQRAKAKAEYLLSPVFRDKVIYELQDKMIDLKRIQERIQAIGGVITDMNNAYQGEELYHQRLAHRFEKFEEGEVLPLAEKMSASGVTIDDLEKYLHARHAEEANVEMAKRNPNQQQVNAGRQAAATKVRDLENQLQHAKQTGSATRSIEVALAKSRIELKEWNQAQAFHGTEDERNALSGMSTQDANDYLSGLSPERRAALVDLAQMVDKIQQGTLDTLLRYGLMTKEAIDSWKVTYQNYVPLHRDEAHPDSTSHPIGSGFTVKGDAAKRRTGSNEKVTNILGHILMQRESALTRGEKNLVLRKLYLLVKQNPDPKLWRVGMPPRIRTVDKSTGFVTSNPDPRYKQRDNVIVLRIAGKDVAIVLNEKDPQALRMAQALKNLDVDDLHYVIGSVAKATRYFASINTQFNPVFGIINMLRDQQEAAINLSSTPLSGKQLEVLRESGKILWSAIKNGGRLPKTGGLATLLEEFRSVGGPTGYRDLYVDAADRGKDLQKKLDKLGQGKMHNAWDAVFDYLSAYNDAMENSTRLAAYKVALDHGMSKEQAASLAKNLTLNFNRKGRQTRELGALYAFFNANVQGTARMAKTLVGPAGRKIMAGGAIVGAASTLLGIAAMGGGGGKDDEWEKIPEWIKQRNLIIPISHDDYLSIPMPFGFSWLPNLGRLMVETMAYKDKTVGKSAGNLLGVLLDAFDPLGSGTPLQLALPTVARPAAALAENKDWSGKAIYREDLNKLHPTPGESRGKDSATPVAKWLSMVVNRATSGTEYVPGAWSPTPDQIDYVLGQITGGVGRELGKVSSTVSAPFTGEELPPYKIPLVGRLYGTTSGTSGQSSLFYEKLTQSNEMQAEIKGRAMHGGNVAEYLRDHPGAIQLAAMGNAAESQLQALRRMRSDIVHRDPPDKVAQVRAINERMAAVMRGFNRQASLMN